MPFLSALEDRAWKALDRGWELLEYRDRASEVQRRHEAEGRVRGLFAGDDELTRARCAEEIARLARPLSARPETAIAIMGRLVGNGLSSCNRSNGRRLHFMCWRIHNLIQTVEAIMTAPAIFAEQSEAKVPDASDGQTPLSLSPDRDANLHRDGIYQFEIEAIQLNKVLKATVLPTWGAPFLVIEVSSSALKIISQTKDTSFDISASVPLLQCAKIGSAPIRFEVDRELMMNFTRETKNGPIFKSQLAFTFDRNSSSLSWSEKGGPGSYCIKAHWVPPAASRRWPAPASGDCSAVSRDRHPICVNPDSSKITSGLPIRRSTD